MQPTNLYNIYLMLYVQSWTPDDGQKDRPKHAEWYSVNSKNCATVWFYCRNISWCTVPWTSKRSAFLLAFWFRSEFHCTLFCAPGAVWSTTLCFLSKTGLWKNVYSLSFLCDFPLEVVWNAGQCQEIACVFEPSHFLGGGEYVTSVCMYIDVQTLT